ncbi:MAG: DUF456 domain-containing protein [Parcubacteria group bacterium]|nr:DUF456 domain-containing protein [Parcubacteria group bacterium]
MEILSIIIIILVVILFLLGVIGVFIPTFPDTLFIFLGLLVFAVYDRLDRVSIWVYSGLFFLLLALLVIDYAATVVGARKAGASRWSLVGGLLGAIVGVIIGNIIGLFLGFFMGVVLVELLVKKDIKKSLRAGGGAILGFLGGVVVKLAVIVIIAGVLTAAVIF